MDKEEIAYYIDWTAAVLILIGAIAWGLIGGFQYDIVTAILASANRIVWSIVGISGLWVAGRLFAGDFMEK